jgi:hypothetical protein
MYVLASTAAAAATAAAALVVASKAAQPQPQPQPQPQSQSPQVCFPADAIIGVKQGVHWWERPYYTLVGYSRS